MNEHDDHDEQDDLEGPGDELDPNDLEEQGAAEEPLARLERGQTLSRTDEPVDVEVRDPLDRVVPLRLTPDRFDALAREARELGLTPAALARMWVVEHLRELERGGAGPRPRPPAPEREGQPRWPPVTRDFDDERPPRPRYGEAPFGRQRPGDGPPPRRPARDFDDDRPLRRPYGRDDDGPPRRPRPYDDAGPPRSAPRPYQGGGPPRRPGPPRGGPPGGGGFDRGPRRPPPQGGRPGPRRPRRDE